MTDRAYKFGAFAFIFNGILLIINILSDGYAMPFVALCTGICFANMMNAKGTKKMYDCHIDTLAEVLAAANSELNTYGKRVMLQLDGRYRVVNWPTPPETVITEGLEYKWIGVKKVPDWHRYLRNH